VTALSLGATYSLDVVRWVPFVDLGLSLADLRGGGASSQRLGPQVGLGAEYLLSDRWTLAALARFDFFALRLAGSGGAHPWWGLRRPSRGPGFLKWFSQPFVPASCRCGHADEPQGRSLEPVDISQLVGEISAIGQSHGLGIVCADEERRRTGLRLGDVVQTDVASARPSRGGRRVTISSKCLFSSDVELVDTIDQTPQLSSSGFHQRHVP